MKDPKTACENLTKAFEGNVSEFMLSAIKHACESAYYLGQADGVSWATSQLGKIQEITLTDVKEEA